MLNTYTWCPSAKGISYSSSSFLLLFSFLEGGGAFPVVPRLGGHAPGYLRFVPPPLKKILGSTTHVIYLEKARCGSVQELCFKPM